MSVPRVLVVEDNHEVRRMVTASIKTLGDDIEVLDVPSAEEALVVSASQPLGLVVIDIRLPGMSGLEMVARLRKRKPEIKIILVTGVDDIEIRKQVAEAGAEAYFYKPIDIQAFLDAVKRSLAPAPQPLITFTSPVAKTTPISTPGVALRTAQQGSAVAEPAREEPPSTSYERLVALKKQVKAVSALLVNDAGQILEEAGTATEISTGSPLLQALMRTFRASLQVSQAVARGSSESLQYFVAPRQCIYVAPVGLNHCLFVVTSGYFGPDKLGMIYHAVHLAVRDLQGILVSEAASNKEPPRLEISHEVAIDKETLTKVEGIFSHAQHQGSRERADGFWENVENSNATESASGKEVISYDQARKLGLTPTEDNDA